MSDTRTDSRTDRTDEKYTDPSVSGLRSGKGNGFFRRLLFGSDD